jgi:hypothetical protein
MQQFEDHTRVCVECAGTYLWTARDQRFAHDRGILPPKRLAGMPRTPEAAARARAEYAR